MRNVKWFLSLLFSCTISFAICKSFEFFFAIAFSLKIYYAYETKMPLKYRCLPSKLSTIFLFPPKQNDRMQIEWHTRNRFGCEMGKMNFYFMICDSTTTRWWFYDLMAKIERRVAGRRWREREKEKETVHGNFIFIFERIWIYVYFIVGAWHWLR